MIILLDFRGRTVIVTGANGTLGAAVAKIFKNLFAILVQTDRDVDRLGQRFPELLDSNQHMLADVVDVTNPDSVNRLVEKVLDQFKHIDVLVNTVGGFSAGTILSETPSTMLYFMLSLNTRSVFVTSQVVLPHMTKEKH